MRMQHHPAPDDTSSSVTRRPKPSSIAVQDSSSLFSLSLCLPRICDRLALVPKPRARTSDWGLPLRTRAQHHSTTALRNRAPEIASPSHLHTGDLAKLSLQQSTTLYSLSPCNTSSASVLPCTAASVCSCSVPVVKRPSPLSWRSRGRSGHGRR
ncbi:hypothetical protein K402DRAFT_119810 [Aulographum hederae CBS 113979]|uniref:Uncharacterized protein n=1 Tax=Aulographum hederae CBS 113979 TaxID=1176131 RepID=A0A6G1GVS2_9PEZI|nr:hypothetical protein K402DRAFT_119810 [Aulographum hederae CBS 113979]